MQLLDDQGGDEILAVFTLVAAPIVIVMAAPVLAASGCIRFISGLVKTVPRQIGGTSNAPSSNDLLPFKSPQESSREEDHRAYLNRRAA
jgi:hypothetical protein